MPVRDWKRENVWLRMLLMAPTGGGKTLGALAVACNLLDGSLPITAIDTEHERMKLYADAVGVKEYRVIEGNYSPETYIKEIDEAEAANPGGILVVDSVTHEWNNKGGILEIVDKGKGGNWKEGTPRHNSFVERLMACQMHLIVCCRAKMKYDYSTGDSGKLSIDKLGVGPEQRDSFLYEFDVVGDIEVKTHQATFSNRCRPLVDKTMNLVPDLDDLRAPNPVAQILTAWLSEGEPPEPPKAAAPETVEALRALLLEDGHEESLIEQRFAVAAQKNRGVISPEYVEEQTKKAQERIATKAKPVAEPAAT